MHHFQARPSRALCSALLAAALPTALAAQGQFVEIPTGSTADAVSADGGIVTGSGSNGVFRWTRAGGTQYLGVPPSSTDLSADGSVIMATLAGSLTPTGLYEAAYWTQAGGWINLFGLIGNSCSGTLSSAYAMSDDGQVIVGLGWQSCFGRPFRWDAQNGMIDLGLLGERGRASAVSGDGSVAGGWDQGSTTLRRAAVWFPSGTSYNEMLIIPPSPSNPNGDGEVWDMNYGGSVIVGGENAGQAWRWKNGVFKSLGGYPGSQGGDSGTARATNADGSMIVGVSGSGLTGYGPFMWTEEDGMQKLTGFLANQSIAIPPGPPLTWAFDISPSGYHIVGRRGEPIVLPGAFAYWVELPAGVRYGMQHTGTNTMRLSGTGSTALGGTLTVTTDLITSNNPLTTLIGTRSTRLPLFGGTLLVDLTPPLVLLPGAPSGGTSSFNLSIPQVPAAIGAALYMQSVIIDPSAGQVLYSNGIKATVTS